MANIDTPETQKANRRFIQAAMKKPLLEADHEVALARAWRDNRDQKALHQLTLAYMRLVISVAGKFRNYGLPMADLVQEGNVGLMQAAAKFDPERGFRFSTYATWWIRSCIQDYVLRNWSIVRTGTTASQKSLFFKLRRLRALLEDNTNVNLSPQNREIIAERLSVDVRDVESMESRLTHGDRSLNAVMGEEGGAEWVDTLADDRPLPEEQVMETNDTAQHKRWIDQALEGLNERELMIIRERRLRDDTMTLESLGKKLGVSKERVRQIEFQALTKLKKTLTQIVGDTDAVGLSGI